MPPVMQRPRCSMKLPKIFLSMAPRWRSLWIRMRPDAARARVVMKGAEAEAARMLLRESFMVAPRSFWLPCRDFPRVVQTIYSDKWAEQGWFAEGERNGP